MECKIIKADTWEGIGHNYKGEGRVLKFEDSEELKEVKQLKTNSM